MDVEFLTLCTGGVDSQAAFCILVLRLSIAISTSSLVFSDILHVVCSFKRALNKCQFVFALDRLRSCSIFTTVVSTVIIIGKCSDVRS